MPIKYINDKEKAYYLHEGRTKTGKPKYYFSPKCEGNLAKSIPSGYEIYEHPRGQVYLRKIAESLIAQQEIEIVENGLREYSDVKFSKLDIKRDVIWVYAAANDLAGLESRLGHMGFNFRLRVEECKRFLHYEPEMQFHLVDKESRLFAVKRFCYRSWSNDWITISNHDTLESQVKRFVPHIGKESYFEQFGY